MVWILLQDTLFSGTFNSIIIALKLKNEDIVFISLKQPDMFLIMFFSVVSSPEQLVVVGELPSFIWRPDHDIINSRSTT